MLTALTATSGWWEPALVFASLTIACTAAMLLGGRRRAGR